MGSPANSLADPDLILGRAVRNDRGCLIWQGERSKFGYGRLRINYERWLAHRARWVQVHGPIPDQLTIDHTCYEPGCVEIDHLRLLTLAENVRGRRVNTAPNCKNDHPWSPENTGRYSNGYRYCRACKRIRSRKKECPAT